MENAATQDTLRDTLEASFDQVVTQEPRQSTIAAAPTAEETAAKEQRARDEAGRFAKEEKTEKPATTPDTKTAAQATKAATGTAPTASQTTAPAAAAPTHARPSSWKKDYWADYDKIAAENPKLADYLNQREREFANGVSAYKAEAENARQLNEAIAPFVPVLQQHGVEAPTMIRNLFTAHQRLALGTPQDKVMMGVQLIKDYGIDPQALFQVLSGQQPQFQQPAYTPPQPVQQPQDIERIVEAKLTQKEINNEYQRFISEAPEKYPHFEAVKETMAGLLQAELAQDYASAYEAAIRHPRHAAIFEAMQQQQREQAAAAEREKSQSQVRSAKARAVSTPSATPSGAASKPNGKQGLRDSLSEAFDNVMSSRV